MATGRDSDKFMLRLPEGLRDRIKATADQNNRSMNAEIVSALEFWLSWTERPALPRKDENLVDLPTDGLSTTDIYDIIGESVREALAMYEKARAKD